MVMSNDGHMVHEHPYQGNTVPQDHKVSPYPEHPPPSQFNPMNGDKNSTNDSNEPNNSVIIASNSNDTATVNPTNPDTEPSTSSSFDHTSTTNPNNNMAPAPQQQPPAAAPPLPANFPHAHDSVVPDLMRVYESMTGGSGTDNIDNLYPISAAPAKTTNDQSIYQPWSFDTNNIPVPPIPEMSFAAMSAAAAAAKVATTPPPDDVESKSTRTNRSGRALRKRPADANKTEDTETPNNSKSRRKNTKQDGRWSKRFTWPEDLHRDFVSAVFDVGLKNASPSAILENMPKHEQITSERIKSHLQKYRLHRVKSKKEFMTQYNATLAKMQQASGVPQGTKSLAGGEVAGHLAYVTLAGYEVPEEQQQQSSSSPESNATEKRPVEAKRAALGGAQDYLIFPRLTEDEKRSPIGASMGYMMGLFFTLKQQLELEREAKSKTISNVYQTFAHEERKGRSNLEENTMMKREMQIQMAFQNKMRALKQQEVEKYKSGKQLAAVPEQQQAETVIADELLSSASAGKHAPHDAHHHHHQGAGEQPPDAQIHRDHSLSIDNAEDFWNTDAVDDQLFEFLMNN